jgi:hypothetical protein
MRPILAGLVGVLALVGPAAAQAPAGPPAAPEAAPKVRTLPTAAKPWTGDFDRMLARRMIRVLVPFSRMLYFNDRGRERGLTGELVRDFEQYVNKKFKTGTRPLTVYIVDAPLLRTPSSPTRTGPSSRSPPTTRAPGSIAKARREAEKRGLDPDKWFNDVEVIVAEKTGREPTTYVRNIYKYYVAYSAMIQADEARKTAREQMVAPAKP